MALHERLALPGVRQHLRPDGFTLTEQQVSAAESYLQQRAHRQRMREAHLPEAERARCEQARQQQQAGDEQALLMQLTREALGLPFDPLTAPRRGV
ncbi:hypothetical protein D3C80_1527510 [compost metagenome]|uniref:hypothetical protein n=1 Tax=Pseudomonas TaxID=286 RepID=UPI000FAD3A11|nr:hypothetical protein [Pseudomonas sp. MYb187]